MIPVYYGCAAAAAELTEIGGSPHGFRMGKRARILECWRPRIGSRELSVGHRSTQASGAIWPNRDCRPRYSSPCTGPRITITFSWVAPASMNPSCSAVARETSSMRPSI